MSETAYKVGGHARSFGQWLVWRPLRLLLVVVVILVVWAALATAQSVGGDPEPGPTPTETADGLPSGWQDWPQTTAEPR